MSETKKYSLDKTSFEAMKVEEAGSHNGYWKNKTLKERLEAACYLTNQFFGVTSATPIDKTVFDKRKHKNG